MAEFPLPITTTITLPADQFDAFVAMCDEDPKPCPRLAELFARPSILTDASPEAKEPNHQMTPENAVRLAAHVVKQSERPDSDLTVESDDGNLLEYTRHYDVLSPVRYTLDRTTGVLTWVRD